MQCEDTFAPGQVFKGPVITVTITHVLIGIKGIEEVRTEIYAHESPNKKGARVFSLKAWKTFIGDTKHE